MKETIILAPGANGSELLRMLAGFGRNTLGLRVMSRVELSRYALMRSGITLTEEFLTTAEEASVIYSFLSGIGYFMAPSFADAESLAKALRTMRALIPSDEEAELKARLDRGEFPDKNAALIEICEKYLAKCDEDGRIDSISLMRKAIAEAGVIADADFLVLKEYPLMPADRSLMDVVSGGSYEETSLAALCGKEAAPLHDLSFTEGYGRINEIEDILADIYKSETPLDKVVIASADPSSYAQVMYDLSCRYGIPVTYGCGVPVLNSNPARLLKLINEWKTKGYYGIDALRNIIMSDSFDRKEFGKALGADDGLRRKDLEEFVKMAGSLRLSFDDAGNRAKLAALRNTLSDEYQLKVFGWAENFAKELAGGISEFLSEFVRIRTDASGRVTETAGRIDQSAINVITAALEAYLRYTADDEDGDVSDIIPELLNKTVCSENSKAGCLHITSITGALSCMRENLYVCGLGAGEFPGTPAENYLLLDSDLELLSDDVTAPTSENRIKRSRQSLDDLLSLAAALDVKTHLSYSGYSLSELKDQNPSSVLYAIYEKLHSGADMEAFRKSLRQAGYFKSEIAADRLIGAGYSEGADFTAANLAAEKTVPASSLERAWSPSALSNYLQCPRHFYLENILGIRVTEPDDPFEVMSAAVSGTLAHSMMEKLGESKLSKEEFLTASSEAFDEALAMRPPLHSSDADSLKRDFLRMMDSAYEMDPHHKVLSAEEEYSFEHPSGIRLHGYPDRVEEDADGRLIIADFKTKRKIEHVEDDFGSCMQVVVYAWLCEQAGIDISSCEYRYLRKGRTVSCKYDDSMRAALAQLLEALKESIVNNDFPRLENDISCKYCRLNDICNWTDGTETDGETEEEADE